MKDRLFALPKNAGVTLIEALLALMLISVLLVWMVPSVRDMSTRHRMSLVASEVAGVLHAARSYAILHGVNVALKFRPQEDGTVIYTLYRDGDGDGVRTPDIEDGTDIQAAPPRRLPRTDTSIRFGFPPRLRPAGFSAPEQLLPHPGHGRPLDRLDDPIRFNRSDLASFSPTGTATPGTVYLTDGRHELMAVRVRTRAGLISTLRFDAERGEWVR